MVDVAVLDPLHPLQVVDIVHPLQVHGDPFTAVGDLPCDRFQVDAACLLKIGELGNFHAVEPDLPAKPPGAEGRGFPVVFDEADVVLVGIDAE